MTRALAPILTALVLLLAACSTSHRDAATVTPSAEPSSVSTQAPTAAAGGRTPTIDCSDGAVNDERGPLPSAVSFVDPDHGWVLARGWGNERYFCVWVGRTGDGGLSWELVGTIPALSVTDEIRGLTFVDQQTGFIFGERLWVTRDGGQTWSEDPVARDVRALVVTGSTSWLLANDACTGAPPDHTCFKLQTSRDGARNWTQLAIPHTYGRAAHVVAASDSHAWLMIQGEADSLVALETSDGGLTWNAHPAPASGPGSAAVAPGGSHLWLALGGQGSAGWMAKAAYRSTDGGASWQLRSEARVPGDPAPGLRNLMLAGYVTTVAAASDEALFLPLARGTLIASFDAGATWNAVIAFGLGAAGGASGMGPVSFLDALHGWAVNQLGVFRTTDGGHTWELARLPGARTPLP